jgi:hypothetical protein
MTRTSRLATISALSLGRDDVLYGNLYQELIRFGGVQVLDWYWYGATGPGTALLGAAGRAAHVITASSGNDGSGITYTAVRGKDSSLYVKVSYLGWTNQGTPGVGLAGDPALVAFKRDTPRPGTDWLFAFVRGSDGHLYQNFWDGSEWTWYDQGTPGVDLAGDPALVAFKRDTPQPGTDWLFAFVRGSDDHLYQNYWDGSQWQWYDQGRPGMGLTTGPVDLVGDPALAAYAPQITVPTPTVKLTAAPNMIDQGQSTALTWSSQDANAADLEPAIGSVPVNGSRQVSPHDSTQYKITVNGLGGTASDTAWVWVRMSSPPPPAIANVLFFNCSDDQHTIYIWRQDLSAGTAWEQMGELQPQYDEFGHCPASGATPFAVALPQKNHSYQIVAVDPLRCAQGNDPNTTDCRRFTTAVVVGDPNGVTVSVTVL